MSGQGTRTFDRTIRVDLPEQIVGPGLFFSAINPKGTDFFRIIDQARCEFYKRTAQEPSGITLHQTTWEWLFDEVRDKLSPPLHSVAPDQPLAHVIGIPVWTRDKLPGSVDRWRLLHVSDERQALELKTYE